MATDSDSRELVAKACRILGGLGLTKAASGHVSQLSEDGKHILIRARGPEEIGVRYTTKDEIIAVNFDGKKVDGPDGLATPVEVYIHTWLYKTRPDVRSVIHIHPPTVMLFTIVEKPLLPLYGAYDPGSLALLLDGVPTYGRSVLIRNDELGRDLSAAMGTKQACLMRGHGITTVGASVEDATMTAIRLNEVAEINYRASQIGTPKPISDEDIADFHSMRRKQDAAESVSRARAAWRYYADLTGA